MELQKPSSHRLSEARASNPKIKMRLIYDETQRDNLATPYLTVEAWYPEAGELSLPALIKLESGQYYDDENPTIRWHMVENDYDRTEATVIRKAIELMDGSFEEQASEYCRARGWKEPR